MAGIVGRGTESSAAVHYHGAPFSAVSAVPDRLLDAGEVAELLNVPVRWVREHTRSGLLPHVRLGRYVRYVGTDVAVWVEEQKAGGAAWRRHHPVPSAGTK